MLASLLAFALTAQTPTATKHYVAPGDECRYEFDYPANWVAEAMPDVGGRECVVRLRPADFAQRMAQDDVDLYSVEVALESASFLVAADGNGFDFIDGKLVIVGRGASSDARVVRNERWNGLKGIAPAGCYHEGGGYAGVCEEPTIIAQETKPGGRVWSMRGGPQSDAFDVIEATFRFVDR